jgi:hypothetical protein
VVVVVDVDVDVEDGGVVGADVVLVVVAGLVVSGAVVAGVVVGATVVGLAALAVESPPPSLHAARASAATQTSDITELRRDVPSGDV